MLTKEEYKNILHDVKKYEMNMNMNIEDFVEDHLISYVEKPKREIQVSDIYKDKTGYHLYVSRILDSDYIVCFRFYDELNIKYNINGEYIGDRKDVTNIDLSKRFKLVEITDE